MKATLHWLFDPFVDVTVADDSVCRRGLCIGTVLTLSFSTIVCLSNLHIFNLPFVGLAGEVNFKSDPKGPSYDRYAIEWTAQSSTPITKFKLQWKADSRGGSSSRGGSASGRDNKWREAEIEAVNLQVKETHIFSQKMRI